MKKITKIILILITFFAFVINYNYAVNGDMKNEIEKYAKDSNIDTSNVSEQEILDAYEKFSENYSNEEIINLLEQNKEQLNKKGISNETIEAGKTILKNTDEEDVKKIIKENVDIEDIQEKIEKGYTTDEIVKSIIKEMPTDQKVSAAGKILLANKIVKTVIIVMIILFIYCTILRAIIYKKSGENPIAAFIPIYRQVIMYRICDLSLGYMCLWLLPVFGWVLLLIIGLMKRIYLSQNFGKGVLFGIGMIILPPIFQSIIAFNPNIKYIED